MLKKGEKLELKIEKIVYGGEGLGFYNEMAVFVPMSVPGDILEVEVISSKKTYARALINRILKPSEDRVEDHSKISFEDFHGCDFAMLKYQKQLDYKKEMVREVIEKIGKTSDFILHDTIGSENPEYYRNKIIEPFSKKNGKITSGFYKRKSHDVFEVAENYLQSKLANNIIRELKKELNKGRLSVYNEYTHTGTLRHVMVRTNSKNEAMLVLIINGKPRKEIEDIVKRVVDKCPEIKSAYISINNRKTNFALGNKNILITGETIIKEQLFGINFNISPTSFFQINIDQTKKLYTKAMEYFGEIENKNIVDAYSGTGTIAMIMAEKAKKVYGIELVESATRDAIKTARQNNIENTQFINGKVEDKLIELIDSGESIDGIIFDPPRKGIEKSVLVKVADINLNEMVYVSCNPSTFARDIEILESRGYKLQEVQPVDMFPQTSHIELVGRIVKKGKGRD